MGTHLPSREDGMLISFLIYWVAHATQTGQNLYQLPIFYPFSQTLAYSDPYLTTGWLSLPLFWFTENIVLVHNVNLVAGTMAAFFGMYLLVEWLTKSKAAAIISALTFTFSSLHLHYIVHLHTYLIAGLPFSFYFFLRWHKSLRWRLLLGSAGCFLYQALNAPMTGFFLAFTFLMTLTQGNIRQQLWQNKIQVAVIGLATLILTLFVYQPYFEVSQEFNYNRSIRDAAHFAHSVNRFITPESLLLLSLMLILGYRSRKVLPLINEVKSANPPFGLTLRTQFLIAALGAVLMLGPVLKVNDQTFKIFNWPIPLPYAVLYYLVPGFQAFRTSSRWITVFNFGLSLMIGTLLARSQLKRLQLIFIGLTLTSFFWLTQAPSLQLFNIPQTQSAIYDLVKTRPEPALAEFPVFSWRMEPHLHFETERYFAQIHHQKRLYNGASGFTPPIREHEWDELWLEFPSQSALAHLKHAGVSLILVDFGIYDQLAQANFVYLNHRSPTGLEIKALIDQQPSLKTLDCTETACLYTIQE